MEGEVLDLHHSITKAFSVAAFFGLTLAPQDGARGIGIASASGLGVPIHPTLARVVVAPPERRPPQEQPCGEGMLLIEGNYCPDAEQVCAKWVDSTAVSEPSMR